MRQVTAFALVAGLLLSAFFIVLVGAPAVGADFERFGFRGIAIAAAVHLVATTFMGIAWWRLQRLDAPWVYVWGRALRDAGSELLPLTQLGGWVLGARAPILRGLSPSRVAASVVVDATIEFSAEIAYVVLGLAILACSAKAVPPAILLGPAVLLVMAMVALAALRLRSSGLFLRLSRRISLRLLPAVMARASAVTGEMRRLYRSGPGVWACFLLHFGAWVIGACEAWLILRLMHVSRGLMLVLGIESLVYAARSMIFMLPNGLGVQEGAYVLVGTALGLPPAAALSLSLLKRARDVVIGVPALFAWQGFEWRKRRARRDAGAESAGRSPPQPEKQSCEPVRDPAIGD